MKYLSDKELDVLLQRHSSKNERCYACELRPKWPCVMVRLLIEIRNYRQLRVSVKAEVFQQGKLI